MNCRRVIFICLVLAVASVYYVSALNSDEDDTATDEYVSFEIHQDNTSTSDESVNPEDDQSNQVYDDHADTAVLNDSDNHDNVSANPDGEPVITY
ncbi:hypothetical protein HCN44_002265 [Aphidius gifuensis]|uniref:Uncharacterized protein n=1 Tax=Aphidius gifuensis TaxID=684658 RepID=A0A835CUX3_APHGI|nr:hypothetical protein HCN44_002265 [Aphidius gifuensis]